MWVRRAFAAHDYERSNPAMYVVTNKLTVPPENAARLEEGFAHANERMRDVPGCLHFTLLREEGVDGSPIYIAMTNWEDEAAFQAWITSDNFRRSHANAGDSGAMGEVHSYTAVF
jgi:heme-degrading monooxygenase HmoA